MSKVYANYILCLRPNRGPRRPFDLKLPLTNGSNFPSFFNPFKNCLQY